MPRPLFALFAWFVLPAVTQAQEPAGTVEFFERKIRPVLVEHCYRCHSTQANKVKAGLLLDNRQALLKGGDSGPSLVPGEPAKSRLLHAIGYLDPELQMPPKGKLPEPVIADFTAWVKAGAVWPEEKSKSAGPAQDFDISRRKKEHWSWQPIRSTSPPPVKNQAWPRNEIDRFLLASLEAKGLSPAPATDPNTLLRRLSFDLVGLPPTPAEIDQFRQAWNQNPDAAIEAAVDRLLQSPHFGERWARHWLDLVRYAETRGHEFDYLSPNVWQYRDYVIRAFNADVPYRQFVLEHLAGDLLPRPRLHPTEKFNESILGTGFWFLGEQVHSPVDTCQDKADRFDNMLDVATKTFLGLTVSCARCHDHKFDAISTRDYYALFGFLESSSYRLVPFDVLEHHREIAQKLADFREQHQASLGKLLAEEMRPTVARMVEILQGVSDPKISRLDPKRLEAWRVELEKARKDPADPFHLALLGVTQRRELAMKLEEKRQETERIEKNLDVVVDYRQARQEQWLPDGVGFGRGPVQAGEVLVRPEGPGLPIEVMDFSGARREEIWDRVKVKPGTENDPGALGASFRFNRTLNTPKFQVKTGKVYYQVRGSGRVFANVDGHVMIAGPLHGQVVKTIKTGPQFQWIEQDLTRYKDRRVHLEFTGVDGAPLEILRVVQGTIPLPTHEPCSKILLRTPINSAENADFLACCQTLTAEALDHLEKGTLRQSPDPAFHARLINWLLQRPYLWAEGREMGIAKKLEAVLQPYRDLVGQIRTETRLAPAILDNVGVNETVFLRGNYKTPGETVSRRFLEALAGPEPLPAQAGSGRRELAERITDPQTNPFITRVFVNRVWHHLFGRGIVASVDNFGVLGEAPSHPELLDFLADQFVKDGWSLKQLIRRIALTQAYRMSSKEADPPPTVDPQNVLLHRQHLRRLEGEAIRDALLAVSGRLDRTAFGPPVPIHLNAFQDGRGKPASGPIDGNGRRSIYLSVRRNFLPAMLLAFDAPIPFSTVGRRTTSNVPAQALILLNDPFVHQQSALWAKRIQEMPGTDDARLTHMYLAALGRNPTPDELAACKEFLQARRSGAPGKPMGWAELAHVLVNTKEFIFLP